MDRIDQLIDILNREITDISFDRDAIFRELVRKRERSAQWTRTGPK